MIHNIKVYEIKVEPHESFIFYKKDNKFLSVNNLKDPCPVQPNSQWSADTKEFSNSNYPGPSWVSRYHLPTIAVKNKDLQEYIVIQSLDLLKREADLIKADYNIIVATKLIEEDILAVGLTILNAMTEFRNYEVEKEINRYLELKAFW